jgi:hypothetical protein
VGLQVQILPGAPFILKGNLGNKAVYEIRQPMMQSRKITTVTHPQCRARESLVQWYVAGWRVNLLLAPSPFCAPN